MNCNIFGRSSSGSVREKERHSDFHKRLPKRLSDRWRSGEYMVGMILATVIFLFFVQTVFMTQAKLTEKLQIEYVVEQLGTVGECVRAYMTKNRKDVLAQFARPDGTQSSHWRASSAFLDTYVKEYLSRTFANFNQARNIWNDHYEVVFVRKENPANDVRNLEDSLLAYVLATGGSRKNHATGTDEGNRWLEQGMRRAVLLAGPSFAYVETKSGTMSLRNTVFETSEGLADIRAQNGDLGYLVTTNLDETKSSKHVLRVRTGDNEDNTLHADLDMDDNNILNIRHLDAKMLDVANMRLNATLYRTAEEAESSCRNNWIYIYDKDNEIGNAGTYEGRRLLVTQDGNVYANGAYDESTHAPTGTRVGTFGMNDEDGASSRTISTLGRLYYISPATAGIPGKTVVDSNARHATQDTFLGRPRLAVCRTINGVQTLAYLGDNRSEDKIAFVVSATDGDFIPPFFCPGQDATLVGGGTVSERAGASGSTQILSSDGTSWASGDTRANGLLASGKNTGDTANASGIMPRLFVIPQFISTGPVSFPLHGIRAWAELANGNDISKGWIIRMNALIDRQDGAADKRSYWIGNYPGSQNPTSSASGYMTMKDLHHSVKGTSNAAQEYISYMKAVVIGVCSNKIQTF